MGYTHYWSFEQEQSVSAFRKLQTELKRCIRAAHKRYGIDVRYESDCPNTPPLLSPDIIWLNGVGRDGHETFQITRNEPTRNFCKTDRKPYDLVVCCALLLAREHLKGFTFRSDGFDEEPGRVDNEWKDAVKFLYIVLGREFTVNGWSMKKEQ